jgi:hypothetical protein
MTKAELIAALAAYPDDTEVVVRTRVPEFARYVTTHRSISHVRRAPESLLLSVVLVLAPAA